MSNKTITDYTAAVSIDAAADYLLLEQSSVYKKISRNVLLSLASAPLGLTDSQSPTNKVFDNTNSLTIKDGSLTIQNSSSVTKQAVFSLSTITAGQTRTITVPDASLTLVGTATTQTLTNKTLTSPVITGGTIDNSTITVDSIAGHTTPTTVTVANLQIANGVLNTNNSVVTANLTDGAVTPAKLTASTGSGWAWSSWAPTPANLTKGNGVQTSTYIQVGKTVFFRYELVFGTTTVMGTDPSITLPVTAVSYSASTNVGTGGFTQTGTAFFLGVCYLASTTTLKWFDTKVDSTYAFATAPAAAVPFSWGTGHVLTAFGFYEAA